MKTKLYRLAVLLFLVANLVATLSLRACPPVPGVDDGQQARPQDNDGSG